MSTSDSSKKKPTRQELEAIVLERQRLEKIGLLVSGIAHNMAGPLAGLIGKVDILSYKHPEFKEEYSKITQLGRKIQNDLSMFLIKSRKDYLQGVYPVNFINLIKQEIQFYRADPRLKHNTEIKFDHPETVPEFTAVYADFSQSFSNFLTNAVEAMDHDKGRKLLIKLWYDEKMINYYVRDNGCGMDEQVLERAFDPFFTTKKRTISDNDPSELAFGLGLTHAKNLLDPLDCSITIVSKPQEGTTVEIGIPYQQIDAVYKKKLGDYSNSNPFA